MRPRLLIPPVLFVAGALAGRFFWPKEAGGIHNSTAVPAPRTAEPGAAPVPARPSDPVLGAKWDFVQRLGRIKPEECAALWAELAAAYKGDPEEGDEHPVSAEQSLLARRWAELDPEGALAFLSKQRGKSYLLSIVFQAWARTNPDAAMEAVALQSDNVNREAAFEGLLSGVAGDPAALIRCGRKLAAAGMQGLKPDGFDRVIPPEALRRAYAADPKGVREIGANMPEWFARRLAAFDVADRLGSDLPGALARLDAAGLNAKTAELFFRDLLPDLEKNPDKVAAVMEHLTKTAGVGWLTPEGDQHLQSMVRITAKAAPDRVRALLDAAGGGRGTLLNVARAQAAADLFSSDPRLALQLAPADSVAVTMMFGNMVPQPDVPPGELLDILRGAPFSGMRNQLMQEALRTLQQASPGQASAWVAGLPEGELRETARAVLEHPEFSSQQSLLEQAGRSAAAGGGGVAPAQLVRDAARRAASADPAATASQVASWPAGTARDAALDATGEAWAGGFAPDALAWAESLPTDMKGSAMGGVLRSWAEGEPAAASEYLASLPGGPARDAPAAGFARGCSLSDPASALQWAATVQDPALRQEVLTEVASRWLAKNADGARQALGTIPGLTADERRQLLNAPPPR